MKLLKKAYSREKLVCRGFSLRNKPVSPRALSHKLSVVSFLQHSVMQGLAFLYIYIYILCCQLNRSDSDSSTLAKKSLFVRNSTERRSLRVKRVRIPSAAARCPGPVPSPVPSQGRAA